MICPEYLCEGLELVFHRIERERMQGLPILNPALQVRAVGFRAWQGHCLGVLITPWFMNLMLLPSEGDAWQGMTIGDKQLQLLPSGPYEFILGEESGVGRYQVCSLFSPVFEFADQETAETTAEAVMQALMSPQNRDTLATRENETERRRRGQSESAEGAIALRQALDGEAPRLSLEQRLVQSLSRRDLLRGRLTPEDQA
jgi:[NiFe] hydrogenase assembly HybE family chaperone